MSVNIRSEPDGHSGLIAEGTYLWDAAKRLGVRLPAECEGRGECDTCAVVVLEGATLLSSLTRAEREKLSPERLAAGERLACQVKIEHAGDLVLRPVPVTEREETTEEAIKGLRKEFRDMPLERKIATLVELEAVTFIETINAIAELPFTIGGKLLDVMAGKGRQLSARDRAARRPAEHHQPQTKQTRPNEPSA